MRGITLICLVALTALAALSFLPTSEAAGQRCTRLLQPCPEGQSCVMNFLATSGTCSSGAAGEPCGGLNNVSCKDGLECRDQVCTTAGTTTSTTEGTDGTDGTEGTPTPSQE